MKIIDYIVDENGNIKKIEKDVDLKIIKEPDVESHNTIKEVEINGVRGFLKDSNNSTTTFDKFEFLISKLGQYLDVKSADEYLVEDGDRIYLFSKSVLKENEKLIMTSNINNEILKKYNISEEMIQKLAAGEDFKQLAIEYNLEEEIVNIIQKAFIERNRIQQVRASLTPLDPTPGKEKFVLEDDNIEFAINIFIDRVKNMHLDNEEEIIRDYIRMCFFDALIGNKDRNMHNYGLVKKEDGSYTFAPLFDSSTIVMPDRINGGNIDSKLWQINEYFINRKETFKYLIKTYPNYIMDIIDRDIDKIGDILSKLSKEILNEQELYWFNDAIIEKLNSNTFQSIKGNTI